MFLVGGYVTWHFVLLDGLTLPHAFVVVITTQSNTKPKTGACVLTYSSVEYDSTTAQDGLAGNGPGNNLADGNIHIYSS